MQELDDYLDKVKSLPPAPRILPELLTLLRQDDVDGDRVVKLILFDPAITASTYRYERLRAVSSGVIESAAATFLLLIALRWYQAGSVAKAIVAGSSSCGLLLSPAAVYWTARLRWTTSLASSRLMAIACACMLAPAIVPWESVVVIGTTFSLIASSSCVPLFTTRGELDKRVGLF